MSLEFQPFIRAVARGATLRRDLTREEAQTAMRMLLSGQASPAQAGAFLLCQRVKGETELEIQGFTDAVRADFLQKVPHQQSNLLDFGVPYNGKTKTAQLLPAIQIALALCGVPSLSHGAEGVPTKQGVTPGAVFRALGIPTDFPPSQSGQFLDAHGLAFVSAEQFCPQWLSLLPMRNEFGLRTALNSVEKLFNPADAPFQLTGFFHGEYLARLRLYQTGTRQSWIVQGEEGSIEMPTGRATHIFAEQETDDWILDTAQVGLTTRERVTATEVTPAAHAAVNLQALHGEDCPATEQVALTGGAILTLLKHTPTLAAGYTLIKNKLQGEGERKLKELRS
jgi:anthranilate phosphoribosyltransferase